jgi:hypothetical protein
MAWLRTSTIGDPPSDPIGEAVAEALADVLARATVELSYTPSDVTSLAPAAGDGTAVATGAGPSGWRMAIVVSVHKRLARIVGTGNRTGLVELLGAMPVAGVRAAEQFRSNVAPDQVAPVGPALRRAVRDTVAAEILARYLASRVGREARSDLIAETIEYLVELSGTRVESHDLTHGVIVTDALPDKLRLEFAYPADIRAAKRAPLLFDGQRSVLVLDPEGRARTELQRHRLDRLDPRSERVRADGDGWIESGALVADATGVVGGLGFFVRADRTIWTFVDGRPLLVRRAERWTAFPLELSAAIENIIGSGSVASLLARAAFMISAQPRGAILAVVDDPARLDGVVSPKDRYDLRNDFDPAAMRIETRLHHLIDADDLDERTLVRLATLDGATILDREGHLLAYGAIVTSTDSQHEGARTAAAGTLSKTADVVLNVSVDGDITIFRDGAAVTTLLGRRAGGA